MKNQIFTPLPFSRRPGGLCSWTKAIGDPAVYYYDESHSTFSRRRKSYITKYRNANVVKPTNYKRINFLDWFFIACTGLIVLGVCIIFLSGWIK